jgi:hypothetical protein
MNLRAPFASCAPASDAALNCPPALVPNRVSRVLVAEAVPDSDYEVLNHGNRALVAEAEAVSDLGC